jgi:3D (Asp-Asp-Asp) domain-containing protein
MKKPWFPFLLLMVGLGVCACSRRGATVAQWEGFTTVQVSGFSAQALAWDAYFSGEDPSACKLLWPADGALEPDPNYALTYFRGVDSARLVENGRVLKTWKLPLTTEEHTSGSVDFATPRTLECQGFDPSGRLVAYDRIAYQPMPPLVEQPGLLVGSLWITYYYLSVEMDWEGPREIPIYDRQCRLMAHVPYAFAREVCVEGSGRLFEGTVINYAGRCDCSIPCPLGGRICYLEVRNPDASWGLGSRKNPLVPFRSVAVDNNVIPHGATLYMPEWDGVPIPLLDGIGGFVHDGCFRADDVGGAIKGDRFDFFSGTRGMWLLLERRHRTRARFTVYMDSGRCRYLAPAAGNTGG